VNTALRKISIITILLSYCLVGHTAPSHASLAKEDYIGIGVCLGATAGIIGGLAAYNYYTERKIQNLPADEFLKKVNAVTIDLRSAFKNELLLLNSIEQSVYSFESHNQLRALILSKTRYDSSIYTQIDSAIRTIEVWKERINKKQKQRSLERFMNYAHYEYALWQLQNLYSDLMALRRYIEKFPEWEKTQRRIYLFIFFSDKILTSIANYHNSYYYYKPTIVSTYSKESPSASTPVTTHSDTKPAMPSEPSYSNYDISMTIPSI
jgi:hypothetical protein